MAETVRKTEMTPPRTKKVRRTRTRKAPRAARTITPRRRHPRMTPGLPRVTPMPMIPTDNPERNVVEDAVAVEVVLETTTRTRPVTPEARRPRRSLQTNRARSRVENRPPRLHQPRRSARTRRVVVTNVAMPGSVMRRSRHSHRPPRHRRNRPAPRLRSPRNRGRCTVAACEGRHRAVEPLFTPFDLGFLQRRNA